jgi:hypothetical protein
MENSSNSQFRFLSFEKVIIVLFVILITLVIPEGKAFSQHCFYIPDYCESCGSCPERDTDDGCNATNGIIYNSPYIGVVLPIITNSNFPTLTSTTSFKKLTCPSSSTIFFNPPSGVNLNNYRNVFCNENQVSMIQDAYFQIIIMQNKNNCCKTENGSTSLIIDLKINVWAFPAGTTSSTPTLVHQGTMTSLPKNITSTGSWERDQQNNTYAYRTLYNSNSPTESFIVYRFKGLVPNNPSADHFCLVVEIYENTPKINHTTVWGDIYDIVSSNSSIAWKNLTVFKCPTSHKINHNIGNLPPSPSAGRDGFVELRPDQNTDLVGFNKYYDIGLDLSEIPEKFLPNEQKLMAINEGVLRYDAQNRFMRLNFLNENKRLRIPLDNFPQGETYKLGVVVSPKGELPCEDLNYSFLLEQHLVDENTKKLFMTGGQQILVQSDPNLIKKCRCKLFWRRIFRVFSPERPPIRKRG